MVWAEVNRAILSRDWDGAGRLKRAVEDRARQLAAERDAAGVTWTPRFFHLELTKEGGWQCWPRHPAVPPAPIVVPS